MFKYNEQNNDNAMNDEKLNRLNEILEKETQLNKKDAWNKLDKTVKLQKLYEFADRYVASDEIMNTQSASAKNPVNLKLFLSESLNKGKFQKAKDVVYNKETGNIVSIPSLAFNNVNKSYTLRILDPKRVSTLKSLAPRNNSSSSSSGKVAESLS